MQRLNNAVPLSGLTSLLLAISLSASAAGVHQHGLADAAVVLEEKSLTVTFSAPLMDILGTTRPPGDAAARVRYAQRLAQITTPTTTSAADCKVVSARQTTVEQLFPEDHSHRQEHDHENEHQHQKSPEHDGHEGDHEADHEEVHQDVQAEWRFVCQHPDALNVVTLPFLNTFSSLTTEVVLLLPSGQNALRLAAGNPRIPLE